MHVEFRQQTYSLVTGRTGAHHRPGRGGRPLDDRRLGRRPSAVAAVGPGHLFAGEGRLQPRARRPARHGRGRGAAGRCPPVAVTEPPGWLSLILAVLVANLVGALADHRRRSSARPGYPGPQLWREQLVPIAVVSPVVVVGRDHRPAAGRRSAPWAWLLVAAPARPSSPCSSGGSAQVAREGHSVERVYDFARRVEQVSPTRPAPGRSSRPSGNCSTPSGWRSGCRPTSTRSRAWSSPPRTARSGTTARATPTTSSAGARSAPPTARCWSPLARADDEEAAALARRGVSDLLGAPVIDRRGRAGLPRGLRPAQRHRLLRRQRPGRAGLDAHPRQRRDPAPAAAHPDPLRRRPRPADRAAQPAAAGRRDRPAAHRRPGRRAGRADPGRARQLHRGHRHPRATRRATSCCWSPPACCASTRRRRRCSRAWRASSSPSCCPGCPWPPPSAPPGGCARPPPPAPGSPGSTSRSR